MLNRILISLSIIIANVCCAAAQPIYLPQFIEHKIIKHGLVKPPYPPLTQWLVERYRKVFPDQMHPIIVRHVQIGTYYDSDVWNDRIGIRSIAITPDGSKVITGSTNGTVNIWAMADGHLITPLNLTSHWGIHHIEMSPDGSKFVTIQYNSANIWSIDGQLIAPLDWITDKSIFSFRISSDGSKCAAGFDHGIVKIWDMYDGKLLDTLKIRSNDIIYEISPDLSKACTLHDFKCAQIWNLPDGTLFRTIKHDRCGIC